MKNLLTTTKNFKTFTSTKEEVGKYIKSRAKKTISVSLAFIILIQALIVQQIFALTSGPSSPDFTAFEPYQASSMVNEFTGDFSYNLPVLSIPGPHGSGYNMSLNYQSGASPEQDASWVGFGWSLTLIILLWCLVGKVPDL